MARRPRVEFSSAVLQVGSGAAVGKQQQRLSEERVHNRGLRRRVKEIEARLSELCQA